MNSRIGRQMRHRGLRARSVRAASSLVMSIFCMASTSFAASDELGRLFYTPTQRAQLEAARDRHATQLANPNKHETPDSVSAPLRFDGVVIRSDGKTTRWVDGKPQRDKTGISGLKPGQIRADGRIYEPYQVLSPSSPEAAASRAKEYAP